MKKRFFHISNLLISSLIVTLGFGSCKTTKKVEQKSGDDQMEKLDSIKVMPGRDVRVLYGPPPSRIVPLAPQKNDEK